MERDHLKPLDGLRGFAVVLVVLSHTFSAWRGGAYGVDVFFVLSGFLITGLLLGEQGRNGRVDYRAFYIRRGLRLLPALIAMLVMVGVFVLITGGNEGATRFPVAALAVLFYVGNWWQSFHNSLGYLSHCWSLGIEEQFYIVWPVMFLLVVRKVQRPVVWLVGALAGEWIIRATVGLALGARHNPIDWTVLRFDGLLLGAIIAVVVRDQRLPQSLTTMRSGVIGALLLAVDVGLEPTLSSQRVALVIGYAVASLGGALLLTSCLGTGTFARAFSWVALAGVGRVSYGIYLYHFPIFQFVSNEMGLHGAISPRIAVEYTATGVAVTASWYLIERPCLRLKDRLGRPRRLTPVVTP